MGRAVSNAMNALRLMTRRNLCSAVPRASDKWVNVTFINQNNGERWPVVGLEGQTLLSVALANKIGVRGGTDRASHVKIAREFEEVVPLSDATQAALADAVRLTILRLGLGWPTRSF